MAAQARFTEDRRSSALVLLALIAPLVFVAAMYLSSRRTERLRQKTIDGALRDYAAVAAWQLTKRLDEALHQEAMRRLGRGPGAMAMASSCADRSPQTLPGRDAFSYQPHARTLVWADSTRSRDTAYGRALITAITAAVPLAVEEPHRVVVATLGGRQRILFLSVASDTSRRVVGIDADAAALAPVVDRVLEGTELLPRSLVRPPFGPRELSVSIASRAGATVFENSQGTPIRLAAHDSTARMWGALDVAVQLQPALATKLLLAGPTRSTTGPFALMLILCALLAVAAVAQLRRSRELARARTRFVANVSHELRTPLTHISMFAETLMLSRERSEAERRHFASVIFREARRLSTLVESVLRFARAEAGRAALHVETHDLAIELHDVATAFAPILRAASSDIVIDVAPGAFALIDVGAFRQIMLNLLDNAVKYGPQGQEIAVRVRRVGGEVRLSVEDRGPGIPREDRVRAFEPFVRLSNGSRRTGTGIGLSVVRELVVAQQGRVWVEDREGGGARVCVALPAAPVADESSNHHAAVGQLVASDVRV